MRLNISWVDSMPASPVKVKITRAWPLFSPGWAGLMWVDGHMVQFQVSGGYNVRPRVLLGRNDL